MAVLGSTTLTGCNSIPDFIAAGSLMFFQSTTAPTGWTKQTTHNDKTLRVVSGPAVPGGTNSFSSTFTTRGGMIVSTVGNTTLSTPQIPSHTHTIGDFIQSGAFAGFVEGSLNFDTTLHPGGGQSGATGGGGSHSHPFTGGSISFEVQYVDLIICSKN